MDRGNPIMFVFDWVALPAEMDRLDALKRGITYGCGISHASVVSVNERQILVGKQLCTNHVYTVYAHRGDERVLMDAIHNELKALDTTLTPSLMRLVKHKLYQ